MSKAIRLYWMRGKGRTEAAAKNFGDWLSSDVMRHVSGREVTWTPAKSADYFAIGSILERTSKLSFFRFRPLKIWGTGSFGDPLKKHRAVKILACRGTLTRSNLAALYPVSSDIPLGDPGLFVNEIWRRPAVRGKVAVILNEGELEFASQLPPSFDFVSPKGEPHEVVRKIASYSFVISSSLHGLVIADAYGIPNRLLSIKLADFKFRDYESAYASPRTLPPLSLADLSQAAGNNVEKLFQSPPMESEIEAMKKALARSLKDSID